MAHCALHNKTFPDAAPHCPWCAGEWEDEEDFNDCTCDITGEDECPVHYPIDDGSDDKEDCMDCGMCDDCVRRTAEYFRRSEREAEEEAKRGGAIP